MPNKYIGTPWLKGGRDLNGFDCWGFFVYFYKHELNIIFPFNFDYLPGDTKNITESFKEQISTGQWMKLNAPENNCAVALSQGKLIHHVGVWYNGGIAHATKGVGVVWNTPLQLKLSGYNRVEYYKWQPLLKDETLSTH